MAPPGNRATFSIPSILAAICAGLAFFDTGLGFLLAIAAIILGLVGVVISLSPSHRGGILSVVSILLGAIAAIVSILGFIIGLFT